MPSFTIASDLAASPEVVWGRVTTPDGIDDELWPWLRMTAPRGATLDLARVRVGEALGRSWILLLGVLPVEYDDIRLTRLDPGRGFQEESRMALLRPWRHERTLDPLDGGGCRVTDRLTWEVRVPGLGWFSRAIVAAVFRWRHRRLLSRFGSIRPPLR